MILSIIVTVVGLLGAIGLGTVLSHIQLILGLLWGILVTVHIKKQKPVAGKVSDYLAGRILVFILFLFFGVALIFPITKGLPFQYPLQMRYLDRHGYHNECFPEKLPAKVENYHMDFMPSIMQGSGWTNVSFRTDAATIAGYISEMEARGRKAEALDGHGGLALLDVHLPKQIKENLQTSQIYVVSFSDDWNHPQIECMVVNEEQGYVMFLEM